MQFNSCLKPTVQVASCHPRSIGKRNDMKTYSASILAAVTLLLSALVSSAEIKVTIDHNEGDQAGAAFKFKNVPSPSKTDAGTKARFSLADGEADGNGGGLSQLNDGNLPGEEDAPEQN